MQIIPCRQKRESMEKLDKERYLKRVIVVCWIALAICFGIKLFGGNLFEIMCNNENFIKVCEYADNNLWANTIISGIVCYIQLYFLVLGMCQKMKFEKLELIVFSSTVIVGTIIKVYLPPILGIIFDLWQLVFMAVVFILKTGEKKKVINVLIGNALLFLFQLISMVTKNIGVTILGESVLEGVIFSIDTFIMIFLYWCYANEIRKEKNKNG